VRLYDLGLTIILVEIVIAAAITFFSVKITGKEDAPAEEITEDILRATTGLDIDFNPNSPEHH